MKLENGIDLSAKERSKVIRALANHCLSLDSRPGESGILREMGIKLVAKYPQLSTNATANKAVIINKLFLNFLSQKLLTLYQIV